MDYLNDLLPGYNILYMKHYRSLVIILYKLFYEVYGKVFYLFEKNTRLWLGTI